MKIDIYNTSNKYQIIYIDPPWPVKLMSHTVRPQQKKMPYKTMSFQDIKNLPIRKLANPDGCHLFLWTTHKWLPKTFELFETWGFKYHCTLTWNKTYGMVPFSFMFSTEFVIYGQLKNKWMRPNKIGLKTLITEKPRQHSRKPKAMRKLIVQYAGDLPRIELFARDFGDSELDGWDVWGDEI